jgi:hypothetical protein
MKENICFVFDLLGMMYAVTLNCRMHFISSGKKWVPIETWSNKKAEKIRDGLCLKPITDHHKHPRLAKAGGTEENRDRCCTNPSPNHSKHPRLGLKENRDGWCPNPSPNHSKHPRLGLKENRDGWCPNPSPNHNKYPGLGSQRKQRWVVLECTWQSQHPLLCLEQSRGWWFQLKKRRRKEVCIKLPSHHKNEEEEEEEKKEGRKLKKTQRDRGKERFVWMNE